MRKANNLSVYSGELVLVNAQHPCTGNIHVDSLVPVGGDIGILLRPEAAAMLEELMAEVQGWTHIVPVSGWRSTEEQQCIWDCSIADNGTDFTSRFVAAPGCSEHQTGLAVDLGLIKEDIDYICPDFPYTGICQAFRERAAKYGFIQRYPAGKEDITGIDHEPWHFRYVGKPHAMIMKELGLVLEEYHALLNRRRGRGGDEENVV